MVLKMEELVHRIDGTSLTIIIIDTYFEPFDDMKCSEPLHSHMVETEGVEFLQFAFRWMNCLLMRELPLPIVVRLWDTYLSEESGFEKFHIYVCAELLKMFGITLQEMAFQDILLFLQHLPTQNWTGYDVEDLLARAFVLKTLFGDTPHHLQG